MFSSPNSITTPVQFLYSGIFSDEKVLQLLYCLQQLSENCFGKLHEVASEGQPSTNEYANRFRRGLESIETWRNEIKTVETNQAIQQYPELGSLYKYAIVKYLKEIYKNERMERIPVTVPSLQEFIHAYYISLSRTSYMRRLEFLNVYGLERTHMHMETLRSTLMDFTRQSIYKPPTSMIGGLEPGLSSSLLTGNNIKGLVSTEKDITQWDSVSQFGYGEREDRNSYNKTQHRSSYNSSNPPRDLGREQPRGPSLYERATREEVMGSGQYNDHTKNHTTNHTTTRESSHNSHHHSLNHSNHKRLSTSPIRKSVSRSHSRTPSPPQSRSPSPHRSPSPPQNRSSSSKSQTPPQSRSRSPSQDKSFRDDGGDNVRSTLPSVSLGKSSGKEELEKNTFSPTVDSNQSERTGSKYNKSNMREIKNLSGSNDDKLSQHSSSSKTSKTSNNSHHSQSKSDSSHHTIQVDLSKIPTTITETESKNPNLNANPNPKRKVGS
jgi:hypothetical protein